MTEEEMRLRNAIGQRNVVGPSSFLTSHLPSDWDRGYAKSHSNPFCNKSIPNLKVTIAK